MTTPIDLAILAALDEEIESLSAQLTEPQAESTGAFSVLRGRLGGCEVLVGRTGIGKVNAALHTQSVILQYRPRAIFFTGVAGSLVPALKVGDLVVATQAIQHDYDLTAFDRTRGFVPIGSDVKSISPEFFARAEEILGKPSMDRLQGVSYFETSPALRHLAFRAYDIIARKKPMPPALAGAVASGDQFIADFADRERIQRAFGALCVEMEGAAAAHACFLSGTPFLLFRFISDSADGTAAVQFDALAREVAARTADLIREIANLYSQEPGLSPSPNASVLAV
ncbi:MAG TPA: 5'-methylthioadenosine/adenosylhomocysteine nucleosidase [Thermoanaerobaculia bacterium]|jgi:adenosylhomocysteine nucleosidase|nr:5'-methylthioadenosine/adenosylhomocysteine nucleosidase [Thermoanaerobaculia bacterium]